MVSERSDSEQHRANRFMIAQVIALPIRQLIKGAIGRDVPSGTTNASLTEIQKSFARRLLLIFLLPLIISLTVIAATFLAFAHRLDELEVTARITTIERIQEKDRNYAWSIEQYQALADHHRRADLFVRLAYLQFA